MSLQLPPSRGFNSLAESEVETIFNGLNSLERRISFNYKGRDELFQFLTFGQSVFLTIISNVINGVSKV